jgi:UDP-2,4-diacetamido-2,4,6-trideoxy-beta-L-altropyranose hydrolase
LDIVIRVDASQYIGTGHVMRCLTLAQALRKKGHWVTFICRDLPANLIRKVTDQGFACKVLPFDLSSYDQSNYADEYAFWLGVSQQQDAAQTLEVIDSCDWLIVDHYGLDVVWESQLRTTAKRVLVIDDLANRPHECDVLLDQNYYQDAAVRYTGLLPNNCQQLLGPEYALIRPEFIKAREERHKLGKFNKSNIERILIFMGGADKSNATGKILQAFPYEDVWSGHVDVIVGALNPYRKEIELLCQGDERFYFHCAPNNYIALMTWADLAIAAGGSSTWERCCIGLPALMFSVASNQNAVALNVAALGAQEYMGKINDYSNETLSELLVTRLKKYEPLFQQIAKARKLVDGQGVERTLNLMC